VVPVVEIPVFARITKLPAVPRDTGAGPVDVGVGVCVAVDVGVCVGIDVGVCVAVDAGVCVAVDAGVCVDVGVVANVAVGVGVDLESVPPQADTSVMDSIMTIDTRNPSMVFFFILEPPYKLLV
jgi:hypothetical protein